MEISANAAVNMALTQQQASQQEQVGVAMLKKSLDINQESAMQLIQTLPNATSLPSHLGQNVNTTA